MRREQVHNTIFTRRLAALATLGFLAVAGCETSESFDCSANPRVCGFAAEVARGINSQAGLALSDQIFLAGATAQGPEIKVTYRVIYTRDQLGGRDIQTLRSIAYESLAVEFCRPDQREFLVEGGRLRLTVLSSDRVTLASSYLSECPEGGFVSGRIRN